MREKKKKEQPRRTSPTVWQLVNDFLKKCSDDHVGAFGAMSAFFLLLSVFPFMLLLLMGTKYTPFSKEDIISVITNFMNFEDKSMIVSLINEIYRKAGISAYTITVLTAVWGSSRGVYSILLGLNSVYDIDENRNYFVLRFLSVLYTVLFVICMMIVMLVWVFGKLIVDYCIEVAPWLGTSLRSVLSNRVVLSVVILTLVFVLVYTYIPNLPRKTSRMIRQIPGALLTTIGWLAISEACSIYLNNFTGFSYVYGSLSWIIILLLWMYWCMSMVFYGAEFNYFLEYRDSYHELIRVVRPKYKVIRRANENTLRNNQNGFHEKNSVYYKPWYDGRSIDQDVKAYMEEKESLVERKTEYKSEDGSSEDSQLPT